MGTVLPALMTPEAKKLLSATIRALRARLVTFGLTEATSADSKHSEGAT